MTAPIITPGIYPEMSNEAYHQGPGISNTVKKMMAEIDHASTGGSIAVDQWRAKHHNRVANACGGTGSNDYAQVMEYAEIRYRELVEAEG